MRLFSAAPPPRFQRFRSNRESGSRPDRVLMDPTVFFCALCFQRQKRLHTASQMQPWSLIQKTLMLQPQMLKSSCRSLCFVFATSRLDAFCKACHWSVGAFAFGVLEGCAEAMLVIKSGQSQCPVSSLPSGAPVLTCPYRRLKVGVGLRLRLGS